MQQLDEIDVPTTTKTQQIKIFVSKDVKELERIINDWLTDNPLYKIIDIQFQQHLSFTCMVVYEQ